MSYISKGDLINVRRYEHGQWVWKPAVAIAADYVRSYPGTGEFVEDWTFVPSVDYALPDLGCTGIARLADVQKL